MDDIESIPVPANRNLIDAPQKPLSGRASGFKAQLPNMHGALIDLLEQQMAHMNDAALQTPDTPPQH